MKKLLTEPQLRELYGLPNERATKKVLSKLEMHSKNFISNSPFVVISSCSSLGKMDASPRGGAKGFIQILNDHQIIIPDFKGNNRIDTLVNIVETGNIGILFMIPGIDETLRINGKATISTDEELLNRFNTEFKKPISCIIVRIEEVFLHCAKAFMRSQLWNIEEQLDPKGFPSMGTMMKDQLKLDITPEQREDMIKRYRKDL